ncbi:MAG: acyl-[Lachnospiraceae bacterium]|nr:acyl-[acyl-carrier-protein] thioesterase [Lachnospiraceae bacterium]
MYQFESRVRFSETDKKRKLTLEAIVDYFQDCSTFQTEDLGVGFSYLLPQNLTWVLSYWQVVIEEYPELGDTIHICTIPYDFKGFFGKRNFFMENKERKRIVTADTLWTLIDMEKMLPMKIPSEVAEAYPKEDKIEMNYLPRKIAICGKEEAKNSITIERHHLDCNNHVNNGQYIKMAAVYLPEEFHICQMRAEYKNQAHLQDVIYPYTYEDGNKVTVCLCDESKKPYVVVEFEGK